MKKLLSFIIVMCIIITAVPINASAVSVCTPYNGDNLESQNYQIATSTIKCSDNVAVNSNVEHEYEFVKLDLITGLSTVRCINCGETTTFKVALTLSLWWQTASQPGATYYSGIEGDLIAGETLKAMMTFSPNDADLNKEFEVLISDESILKYEQESVHENRIFGNLRLLKPGTATVVFRHKYNPGNPRTYIITVKSNATAVSLNKSSLEITTGYKYTLTPTLTPVDANALYSWSSSDTDVATVDSTGTITAKKIGTAVITLTLDNNLKATCNVTVKSNATAVSLDKSSLEMTTDETYTLTPTFTPVDASALCSWSSSNPDVATVDSNGTITAKTAGTAVITLTLDNNLKATCTVTVKNSFISGDINLDGEVNVTDVIMLLRSYISDLTLSAKQIEAADMDNSGDLTVLDAILIQKQILDMA